MADLCNAYSQTVGMPLGDDCGLPMRMASVQRDAGGDVIQEVRGAALRQPCRVKTVVNLEMREAARVHCRVTPVESKGRRRGA